MPEFKIRIPCAVCRTEFQMGRHIYEGKVLPAYKITVCGICYGSNADGWNPRVENAVTAKLIELGLPFPPRNAKGLLPRGD